MRRAGSWTGPLLTASATAALGSAGALLAAGAVRDLGRTPADVDSVVAALAGLALGVLLLVWCAGAAATVGAALVGTASTAGTALRAVAGATTPLLLRRLLAAALGAAVLGGVTGPALAAVPPATATTPTAAGLTWPAAPVLATAPATAPTTATTTPAPSPPAPATTTKPTTTTATTTATASEPARATGPSGQRDQPGRTEVVVRAGDTLWSIAAGHLPAGSTRAAVAAAWPRWYAANRAVIGADPDHLRPGQRLVAP